MGAECELTVISEDDPDDPEEDRRYLNKARKDNPGSITAGSLEDMVDKILKRMEKDGCDCIKKLRIIGHGSEGKIIIGKGRDGTDAKKRINDKKSEWEDQLAKLKPKFCKKARVEFLACWFGAGEKGAKKLSDLADHMGVTAVGYNVRLIEGGYPDKKKPGWKEVVAKPGKPAEKTDRVGIRLPSLKAPRSEFAAFGKNIPDALCVISGLRPVSVADLPRALYIDDRDNIRALLGQIEYRKVVDARMVGGCVDARLLVVRNGVATVYDITDDFEHVGPPRQLRRVHPLSPCGRAWIRQLAFLHNAMTAETRIP